MLDCVVIGGKVVDGTGSPWFYGDVAVKDGRIVEVRRRARDTTSSWDAMRVIDARGMYVVPGFCDLHTHSDYSVVSNRGATSSLLQGVTTECTGMCGTSAFPVNQRSLAQVKDMTGAEEIPWCDLDGYRSYLHATGTGINLVPFVGHGTIRTCVMGPEGNGGERYLPEREELEAMERLTAQAMEQGAFGLSSGLIYPPGRNAGPEELRALCRVTAPYGGVYSSHVRSEEDALIEGVEELIGISRRTGIPASVTHHKAMFRRNWGKPSETTRQIERARREGLEVICDFYPWLVAAAYNLGGKLAAGFPGEVRREGKAGLLRTLSDEQVWPTARAALHQLFAEEARRNEDRSRALGALGVVVRRARDPRYWDVVVHSPSHPETVGLTFEEVGHRFGCQDFWDAMRRLYLDDEGETRVGAGPMCEEDVLTILSSPYSAVSSDASTLDNPPGFFGSTHPRVYGNYAYALVRLVRELRAIRLEDLIRKMTVLPASFIGLSDRGSVRVGNWADLVVLDWERLENRADFAEPYRSPSGIEYVLVNGRVAAERGTCTGVRAGRVLTRGR